jgi:hypothetical protein
MIYMLGLFFRPAFGMSIQSSLTSMVIIYIISSVFVGQIYP